MTFMYGKWRALEQLKALRDKYGENAAVLERDKFNGDDKKKKVDKAEQPFAHLLNKKFKVPQYDHFKFEEKPVITYRITDEEKARNAKRHAAKRASK